MLNGRVFSVGFTLTVTVGASHPHGGSGCLRMGTLVSSVDEHGLMLLEDGSHAHGATWIRAG